MTTITPRLDSSEKNLCINGNMDFWQRGTSLTNLFLTDVFLADRFMFSPFNPTGRFTYMQVADVPTLAQSGVQSVYSIKLICTTPNSGGNLTTVLRHTLEGSDIQSFFGKGFRLQFWVKTSVAGTYTVEFTNYASIAANLRSYLATYTITAGQVSTWQPVVIDLTMDTITSLWAFDNTIGLKLHWHLDSFNTFSTVNQWFAPASAPAAATGQVAWGQVTNATWQIAQVMIIPNNLSQIAGQMVTFHRAGNNIAHELQMCQRYAYILNTGQFGSGNGTASIAVGHTQTTNDYRCALVVPVPFRGLPSIALTSGTFLIGTPSGQATVTGATVSNYFGNVVNVDFATSTNPYNAAPVVLETSGFGIITLSAEL